MKVLTIVMLMLLTGCASIEERASKQCPGIEAEGWHFMPTPPADADAALALAHIGPSEHYFPRIHIYWFENGAGRYIVCQAVLDGFSSMGCGTRSWELDRTGDHWTMGELEHIVVCE